MKTKLLLVLGLIIGSLFSIQAQDRSKTPNIIIIYMDDMGYADLGCYEGSLNATPAIDKMASEGTIFTSFYAGSNICSPSRAALLTGMYPPRASVPRVYLDTPKGINYELTTLAELLKTKDYATALIGKWHLGYHDEFLPLNHGFDTFYGLPHSHDLKVNGELPFYENEKIIERNPDPAQLTTRYTEKAVEYIKENKDKPFFLYLAHNMPHTPLAVSSKFEGKSENGLYGDVIMEIDWSVNQVLEEVKKQGLEENTLIIVSSDNGPSLKQGNHAGNAGIFREGKGTTFEGGHRVPGIFYMPGTVKQQIVTDMTSQIDIFPTIAAMVQAELPEYKIDGVNMLSTLKEGETSPRREFFYFQGKTVEAYRKGNIKIHKPHKYRSSYPENVVINGESGKLKVFKKELEASVFNLDKDPSEKENIINKKEETYQKYLKRMKSFNKKLNTNKFEPELKETK
ncbi:sulfatase [Flammeovirga sp. SubArs3]|uniref:sulfatase family protein n=1 Tax=Flammeovirga sp. SubArs3 TaxID=2995316 RepID=UPI00248B0EAD|nr:sulfatase [Flammeovirga sp. SubArs3]